MAIKRLTSFGSYDWTAAGFTAGLAPEDWPDQWGNEVDEQIRPGTGAALGAFATTTRRIVVTFIVPDTGNFADLVQTLIGGLDPENGTPRLLVGELAGAVATPVQILAVIERPHLVDADGSLNIVRVAFISADTAWRLVTPLDADLNTIPGNQTGSTWSSVALNNTGAARCAPLLTLDPTGQQAGSLLYRYRHEIVITNSLDEDITGEAFELDLNDTTGWVSASEGAEAAGANVYVYRDGVQIPRELMAFNRANSSMWIFLDHLPHGESTTLVITYGGTGGPSLDRMTGHQRPAFNIEFEVLAVTAGSTTTAIQFAGSTWYTDQWDDGLIIFQTGALTGHGRAISSNDADTINVTAFGSAPATGDIALIRASWMVNPGTGSGVANRFVYNVKQVERNDLYRGLWYLDSGQNRPSDYRYETPMAWEPFLFLDNNDAKSQTPYVLLNVGTVDAFAIPDAARGAQGSVRLKDEGGADGVKFNSIYPIDTWTFDGYFRNPNSVCKAFFGSRPNEAVDWVDVREVTTASDTLAAFSKVGNTLLDGTHHLCAVVLPADEESIGPEWEKITGSRTAGGGIGTATLTDGTKIDAFVDDQFVNWTLVITGGTGVGQRKTVTDYVASTGAFTLNSNWAIGLDDTSRFEAINPLNVARLRSGDVWSLTLDLDDFDAATITAQANNYPVAMIVRIDGGATGLLEPYHRLRIGLEDRALFLALATYNLRIDCPNQRAWIEDANGNEVADVTAYVVAEVVLSSTETRQDEEGWLPMTVGSHTLYCQNSGLTTFNIDVDLALGYLG